jgi:hypothetical protein
MTVNLSAGTIDHVVNDTGAPDRQLETSWTKPCLHIVEYPTP